MLHEIMLSNWNQYDLLGMIVDNTAPLRNIQFGQRGLDTYVTRPTLFVAGERGRPERVTVTPNINIHPGRVGLSMNGREIAMATIPYFHELSKTGVLKIHKNALVEH
jgi:hypothetical protein